jgi:deazaflavin-dependent oxidoreductase (nitroreductase family)
MPFPSFVGRINRRLTNPLLRPFAGTLGSLGLLEHRGRTSGRVYQTTVMAFAAPHRFAILLTYGERADWVRNILAAGGGTLTWRRQQYRLNDPVVVSGVPDEVNLPRWARVITSLVRADRCLMLTVTQGNPPEDAS